ncbi:MAG: phytanoyl-CoA dioxygenase family protein [Bacteroidia bacterium]
MKDILTHKLRLNDDGFSVVEDVYSVIEIEQIALLIDKANSLNSTFRKSNDLFAIRQVLKEIPALGKIIFNTNLQQLILQLFDDTFFVVKSIYFDKPSKSNWFVPYHQDLTISVDRKIDLLNFGPWTIKQNQFAVQPPLPILKNIFTIRIHLDDTDENNGALKVITKSHLKDIYRPETIDWNMENEAICRVNKGGVMLMKPLLLHSSNKTVNDKKRRVIHIEFSNQKLPNQIKWAEKQNVSYTM